MTRPPLPWTVAAWVMHRMLVDGLVDAALAVGLMFSTYCRPSEALGVREGDLVDPGPGDVFYALNLFPDERNERSKVGASNESLILDSPFVQWLGAALAARKRGRPDDPLIKISLVDFVRTWYKVHEQLGIRRLRYVPYQLRHGGPSHDMKYRLRSALQVKMRGRWANDRSMKRYEAHARLQRELAKLRPAELASALAAERDLERLATSLFLGGRLPPPTGRPRTASRAQRRNVTSVPSRVRRRLNSTSGA